MEIIQAPPDGTSLQQLTRTVQQLCNFVNKFVAAVPTDSTAADVPGTVADLNELLAALRGLDGR